MDHARHLSSPSPTSPFLFHHPEKASFKTSSPCLTQFLSSTADVSPIDDSLATTTPPASGLGLVNTSSSHHNHLSHHNHHLNHHSPLGAHHVTLASCMSESLSHMSHHHQNQNQNQNPNQHQHQNNSHRSLDAQTSNHSEQLSQDDNLCVTNYNQLANQSSLTGVGDDDDDDDGDGMHNMLSGGSSSSSSTSTIPLLNESHSHRAFSRISLGEYSPLSLVEECENGLPISPMACGSHHTLKAFNGLKMDHLVGDVGVDHDVGNDDVTDAHSMSPSLLSSSSVSNNHHNNLWSNSSTAITQNPALLSSNSTSILLSHHHHQQLNSLMQQLEPQSLDEAPPLIGNNHQLGNDDYTLDPSMANRPSSEPPHCGSASDLNDIECKSLASQPTTNTNSHQSKQSKASQARAGRSTSTNMTTTTINSNSRSRKSRSRATVNKQVDNTNEKSNSSHGSAGGAKTATTSATKKSATQGSQTPAPAAHSSAHFSKLHLQMNHHKKLQELQQRLFGNVASIATSGANAAETTAHSMSDTNLETSNSPSSTRAKKGHSANGTNADTATSATTTTSKTSAKDEPDSSAKDLATSSCQTVAADAATTTTSAVAQDGASSKVQTRLARPARSRRNRRGKSTSQGAPSATSSATQTTSANQTHAQKVITSESAEPDTTTKSSDCIKLADLLANTDCKASRTAKGAQYSVNASSVSDMNDTDDGDRKVPQIQMQVNPSGLTVLANGGLLQQINIQHQQQQPQQPQQPSQGQTTTNLSAVITTNGANFGSQILCRPQTVVATANGQLKTIMPGTDLLKGGDNGLLSNWSIQTSGQASGQVAVNGTANNNAQATIGAHQIAIQVICQDGTSLVLPVSSAAGLNAAVSLASQHQQLQSVLANGNNNSVQSRGPANQVLPLMSVTNMVAQQQVNNETGSAPENATNLTAPANSQAAAANASGAAQAPSGLAASSPTLAALLDAGPSRGGLDLNNNTSGQSLVATNLVRKLMGGNTASCKRSDLTLSTNSALSLSNCAPIVTVCAQSQTASNLTQAGKALNSNSTGIQHIQKRLKLENIDVSNLPSTFTLIDPQALIVVNGNDKGSTKQIATQARQLNVGQQNTLTATKGANSDCSSATTTTATTAAATNTTTGTRTTSSSASSSATTSTSTSTSTGTNTSTGAAATTTTTKQAKMGSSTGNRQVDPAQPFRCEHCNSTFTRLGNFTRHKKIHTVPTKDGQRFKCDVCSKSFLQRCDLARHLHIHRGTEPHRCNICGKGYIRHSDLVTHQRFHNKEKPFGCPECSKGFCQKGDLNRHLRSIHLQMKPILCPYCNRKFAKQETLLRHLNTAHRNKPGTTTGSAIIAKIAPNYSITQGDDKQTTIPVVTNAAVLNASASGQKNAPVASLQAIQATLCKVSQTAEPSNANSSQKAVITSDQVQAPKVAAS